MNWAIDGNSLRRGLMSLKGVGEKAAQEIVDNAPFADMDDLIERTTARIVTGGKSWKKLQTLNGVLEKLRTAGSLECLGVSR